MKPAPSFAPLFVPVSIALAVAAATAGAEPQFRVLADVEFLEPGRAEKLDVYLPAAPAPARLRPAVVWIHGGGWINGTKNEARAKNICTTLAEAGYVALNIDYRLGDGAWPGNLHDCKNAVRFLRTRAAEWRVDPERIAVAGGSAGGHLALMVGFTAGKSDLEPAAPYPGVSSAVRAVIDMYGPANLLTRRETEKDGTVTAKVRAAGPAAVYGDPAKLDVYRAASPVSHITKNSPPVLILHGDRDATVDLLQSRELAAALAKAGVPHELVVVPGAGHTFDWQTWNKQPMSRDLRPVALAYLEEQLGPAAK